MPLVGILLPIDFGCWTFILQAFRGIYSNLFPIISFGEIHFCNVLGKTPLTTAFIIPAPAHKFSYPIG